LQAPAAQAAAVALRIVAARRGEAMRPWIANDHALAPCPEYGGRMMVFHVKKFIFLKI
jgi:hypothetical protein